MNPDCTSTAPGGCGASDGTITIVPPSVATVALDTPQAPPAVVADVLVSVVLGAALTWVSAWMGYLIGKAGRR